MRKFLTSGYVLVSIAALLWGTSFVAIEWGFANSSIDTIIFVFLRFIVASLFFLPIALLKIKNLGKLLISKEIILIGLCNSLSFLFQFLGQQYTTAGKASLFVNFYSIIVPLIAPLILPEKYSWRVLFSAILGFSGAFFVTTNLNFSEITGGSIKGDLFTIGSGMAWTIYILLSKKFFEKDKTQTGTTVFYGTVVWTTVFLSLTLPIALVNKSWSEIRSQFNWQSITAVLYLAIICTVAAFVIYMEGLQKSEAGESTIYMLFEVVVAFLLGWILFKTIYETWEIVGVVMIVFALAIVSFKMDNFKKRRKKENDLENESNTVLRTNHN